MGKKIDAHELLQKLKHYDCSHVIKPFNIQEVGGGLPTLKELHNIHIVDNYFEQASKVEYIGDELVEYCKSDAAITNDMFDAMVYAMDYGKVGGDQSVSVMMSDDAIERRLKASYPKEWERLQHMSVKFMEQFTPIEVLKAYRRFDISEEQNRKRMFKLLHNLIHGGWIDINSYYELIRYMNHELNYLKNNKEVDDSMSASEKVGYKGKVVAVQFLNEIDAANCGKQGYRIDEDVKEGAVVIVQTHLGYAVGKVTKVDANFDGLLYPHQNVVTVIKGVDAFDSITRKHQMNEIKHKMDAKARELDELAKLKAYKDLDPESGELFDEYEKLLKEDK